MGKVEYNPRVCPVCGFYNGKPDEPESWYSEYWCQGEDDSVLDIDCTEEVKMTSFSDYTELMKTEIEMTKKIKPVPTINYIKKRTLRIICKEAGYQLYRLLLKLSKGA